MVNTNLDTTPLPPNDLVAQDPQSAELAGYVRTKTFGRDVRESIARSIELNSTRSKNAEILANETVNVANDLTDRFNQQIGALTEDAEVIDARNGAETLRARLNEDYMKVENNFDLVNQKIDSVAVDVKFNGAVGDGVTDDTISLQTIINNNNNVLFTDGDYLIDIEIGLDIPSDRKIEFTKNARIITTSTSKGAYQILHLHNVSDVELINPKIIGDAKTHLGTDGEWGHGISIVSSKDITIHNPDVKDCWGDGIYYGAENGIDNKRVNITGMAKVANCGRQGVSVVSGIDCNIDILKVDGIRRTAPAAAIDFEPNSSNETISNFNVGTVIASNCDRGVLTHIVNNKINFKVGNIVVDNVTEPVVLSRAPRNYSAQHGVLSIENIRIINTGTKVPIRLVDFSQEGSPSVKIGSIIIDDYNDVTDGNATAVIRLESTFTEFNDINYGNFSVDSILVKRNNSVKPVRALHYDNKQTTEGTLRNVVIESYTVLKGLKDTFYYTGNVNLSKFVYVRIGNEEIADASTNPGLLAATMLPRTSRKFEWNSSRSTNVGLPTVGAGIGTITRGNGNSCVIECLDYGGKRFIYTYDTNTKVYGTIREI